MASGKRVPAPIAKPPAAKRVPSDMNPKSTNPVPGKDRAATRPALVPKGVGGQAVSMPKVAPAGKPERTPRMTRATGRKKV